MSVKHIHSVTLDKDKCLGCTNCIKRCPTEAIRVRDRKAVITANRCIDCGVCIRICPHNAKKAIFDRLDDESSFKHRIALPAPALYGQFDNIDDVDYILTGLKLVGFDDVFEVSSAAEIITEYTRKYLAEHKSDHPYISTACPAVVRLIEVRFPYLRDYLLPVVAPVELAARLAREAVLKKHPELKDEDIGVYFISPCPAKVSYVKNPIGFEKSAVDRVLSMSEIYMKLLSKLGEVKKPEFLSRSGVIGISWATTGGEAAGLLNERYLAADGIENVINVLDEIENENFSGLEYIELNACRGGCVGGVMAVENPYIAKARIQKLRKFLPLSQTRVDSIANEEMLDWERGTESNPALQLNTDRHQAIEMSRKIKEIAKTLPGLDCGSCGAPSCKALAEDIVRGEARESDCIFRMRERIQQIFRSLADIEHVDLGAVSDITDEKGGE
ncbi:MAG: 4Fe-4S binding protein [Clostridia bacterium]|nr:4Fe-4S binding protein [Clostridia bacterium]MBR6742683.1 4Fe-4S binding protein [Clostridia bacterium]